MQLRLLWRLLSAHMSTVGTLVNNSLNLVIIQYDGRYCSESHDGRTTHIIYDSLAVSTRRTSTICSVRLGENASKNGFWWISAAISAAWARKHRHDYLLYCMTSCDHPGSGEKRLPQWCKLVAVVDALRQAYSAVLYLDSDAFWLGGSHCGHQARHA